MSTEPTLMRPGTNESYKEHATPGDSATITVLAKTPRDRGVGELYGDFGKEGLRLCSVG